MMSATQQIGVFQKPFKSKQAVQVNIQIMRAFVQLRRLPATIADIARKLEALEQKYDSQFQVVFDAIRALMQEPEKPKRKIGFTAREKHTDYDVKSQA